MCNLFFLVGCESHVRCLRPFLARLVVLWTSTSPIKVAWSGYQFLLLVQTGKYFLIKNIQKISLYNKQPKMSSIFNAKWKLVQIIFAMQVWLECSHSRMLGWFRISAQIGFPLICCRIIQAAGMQSSHIQSGLHLKLQSIACRAARKGHGWGGWPPITQLKYLLQGKVPAMKYQVESSGARTGHNH